VNDPIASKVAEKYLLGLKAKGVDTLILGCTHYPLLKAKIQAIMGRGVVLIDSAQQVANEVRQVLSQEGLLTKKTGPAVREYYVSDEVAIFENVAKRFLGEKLKTVKKVANV
jgi:glutamate racemase